MNERDQHKGWRTGMAAMSIAATLCAPCAAVAAGGGEIHFSGMIVAPPYSISTSSASSPSATAPAGVAQSGPATTTVTFAAEPTSPPYAEVALTTMQRASTGDGSNTARPLAVKFTDGDGHRLTPDQTGHYHLGASGGSMQIKAPDSSAQTLAVVVTNYD
jgi:type 1 fimbria pilin